MNKRLIIIGVIILVLGVGGKMFSMQFNADFAEHVTLKYEYGSQSVNERTSDPSVIVALKSILKGFTYSDSPSCGFSVDVSLTLTNGEKTVVLCPALDGCSIIRIGETNKYFELSDKNRQKLDEILSDYGFKFPSL